MPRKRKTKLQSAYQVASTKPLVNQYGEVVQSIKPQASTMYDASLPSNQPRTRTVYIQDYYNTDYKNNVTDGDWNVMLSRARELYANVGSVRNAVCEITDMAVGDGWYAKYTGPDKDWGITATAWLSNWMNVADVRGQPWDFHRDLKLACISTLRDGDALCILTTDTSGKFPRIQWTPAHRIGSWGKQVMDQGMFNGYDVCNGIIYNDLGSVIGYNIMGNDRQGKEDTQVSVYDSQLVFDPEYIDQSRGLTALASGIHDWMEYKTIKNFELTGIKHASNFAVQYYVPAEQVDDVAGEYADSPYRTTTTPTGSRELSIETLQGGETNVWRADSGAKLEVLNSNRPSSNTAQFLLDHCLRNSFLSLRWPVEMCFDLNSRGATTKLVVAKAQRRIEDLQAHVIYPIWKRIINYAIAKAIKSGYLPKNDTWWMFEPTFPRSFVLDNYKDIKTDIEMYNRGWTTGTQIAASYGFNLENNLNVKADELKLRDEIAKKKGVNPNELCMLTIQGNVIEDPTTTNQEDEEDSNTDTGNQNNQESDNQENKE